MSYSVQRDLVGYGANPPDPQWPGGARLALNFVMNYEEGSEYGRRVGFWRLMRIFAERNLPMTVYACALALERNPPAAAAIKAAGHDICCHGWR